MQPQQWCADAVLPGPSQLYLSLVSATPDNNPHSMVPTARSPPPLPPRPQPAAHTLTMKLLIRLGSAPCLAQLCSVSHTPATWLASSSATSRSTTRAASSPRSRPMATKAPRQQSSTWDAAAHVVVSVNDVICKARPWRRTATHRVRAAGTFTVIKPAEDMAAQHKRLTRRLQCALAPGSCRRVPWCHGLHRHHAHTASPVHLQHPTCGTSPGCRSPAQRSRST
jgi:hypothetical protein